MIPSGWNGFNSPFLLITLAFIAGILVGDGIPMTISLASLGVTLSLLLVLCRQNKKIGKLLGLALLFTLGALLIHLKLHPTLSPHHIAKIPERKEKVLVGTIYRPPQKREGKAVVYLLVEKICEGDISAPSTGKVRITIRDPSLKLRYGYRVRLSAKLYRPRNFRNPGSFDYEEYLRRRGVLVTGYVRGRDKIRILSKEGGNPLLRQFDRWREKIETFLDNNTLPPGRGLLKALIIGERGEIPKDIREAFIDAGAVHILAISGLHLGIIVTLIFLSAQGLLKLSERALLRYDTRKVAAFITFPYLLSYILITGFPISTIRAGIMASCFLVAILLGRYRNPLNILALAAFLILLISPTSLWDPSFQLSFSSVLGIILLSPPLYRRLFPQDPLTLLTRKKRGRFKKGVFLSLIASFAALVVTAPLVAFHFHRLSSMGLVSNAIIIPLVGLGILPLGLFCLPFIPIFPSVGVLLAKLAAELSCGAIRVVELLSSLPFSACYLPSPTTWEMVIFYSFIASLLWLKKPSFRRTAFALTLLLVLFDLSYWCLKDYGGKGLRVSFLDVGQGDCALTKLI